jgi:hypothetical protein
MAADTPRFTLVRPLKAIATPLGPAVARDLGPDRLHNALSSRCFGKRNRKNDLVKALKPDTLGARCDPPLVS